MKWQCALLQRWLPEYPDGDLPGWGKRWLHAHVAQCAVCRREVAGLKEVVTAIKAEPAKEPGSEFWSAFSRDMHLKLAQAAQEIAPVPSARRWFKLPYLVGAPALVVLLLWVTVHLTGPGAPVQNQPLVMPDVKQERALKMATAPQRTPAPPAPTVAAVPVGEVEQFVPVALEEGTALPAEDLDISGWDLDSELAGMTDQEKEIFLKKMHQRAKDGSCLEKFSLCSWG
jgi:hypothetical protein